MSLIEDVRQVRLSIARKRAKDLTNRYPEIQVSVIEPLDDEAIIMAALSRELAHHQQVLRDMEAANAARAKHEGKV